MQEKRRRKKNPLLTIDWHRAAGATGFANEGGPKAVGGDLKRNRLGFRLGISAWLLPGFQSGHTALDLPHRKQNQPVTVIQWPDLAGAPEFFQQGRAANKEACLTWAEQKRFRLDDATSLICERSVSDSGAWR